MMAAALVMTPALRPSPLRPPLRCRRSGDSAPDLPQQQNFVIHGQPEQDREQHEHDE
jgi:hypothetical protein